MAISASEARKSLYGLIEQVNADASAVEITSKRGNAVLVSADEWSAIQETAYLLRSPANVQHLATSIGQAEAGQHSERTLDRE